MGYQPDLAKMAMKAESSTNDFMTQANLPLPGVQVPGAFPVMVRSLNLATEIHRPMDLIVLWGIGDFGASYPCSSYYDPSSPWYNVFYGAYAISSYKHDGAAWGYDGKGQFNLAEFLQLPELDYNFLTAGQFGCPPSKMCFKVESVNKTCKQGAWDFADVAATIPSALHDPTKFPAKLGTYVVFGIPEPSFLNGRDSYEPVKMHGQFYIRKLTVTSSPQPITLVWGSACPDTPAGNELLKTIMAALEKVYMSLYP